MAKKKILIYNDLVFAGGVEKLLRDFAAAWCDRYEITVLTEMLIPDARQYLPESVCYRFEKHGWDLGKHRFFVRKVLQFLEWFHEKSVSRWIAKEKFDVLLCMKESWLMQYTQNFPAKKRIAWVHTDYHNHYYTKQLFGSEEQERKCMAVFDTVVCVAEEVRRGIVDVLGDPGNLTVLYNPIDVVSIQKLAAEPITDPLPECGADVVRFVSVGRLHMQKGYDLLLEACRMLEAEDLPFQVLIVGGSDFRQRETLRLERRHRQLGLKNVFFLGEKKNPYPYMKLADWFISSSIFEGYSLVSQEAAVLDIPMILTDCSGVRDLLGDSVYGIVTEISAMGLYQQMKRVIEEPQLREIYRKKISERKSIINFDNRLRKIEELFAETEQGNE